jgi:hypothetical protein
MTSSGFSFKFVSQKKVKLKTKTWNKSERPDEFVKKSAKM